MPKVSKQYRDARRAQILDAARQCFLRDGFYETTMQDLFTEVGLSSGAVYRYFDSKDDMVVAIAEESLGEFIATIHAFAVSSDGQGLGEALGKSLEVLERKHANDRFASIAIMSWAEALRNPSLAARAARLLDSMRTDLTSLVRRLQDSGELPKGSEPEPLAAVLMSIVSGFILELALGRTMGGSFADAVRALWPAELRCAP